MISTLASPSVCVVDDEEADFRPILSALNALYVSCVHIKGDDLDDLPERPFPGVRLVFQDLHLTSDTGKTAASHAANVFRRLVSIGTAPVVVVIWSKYADDRVADLPTEDQKTEAQLFRETLEEAEPDFRGRLIYIPMPKPRHKDRPEQEAWIEELKKKISETLQGKESIDALWQWESLVRNAVTGASAELTDLAARALGEGEDVALESGLRVAMQMLAHAQAEGDLSDVTAPRHLASGLAQLLVDRLEHTSMLETLSPHGSWLAGEPSSGVATGLGPALNGLLLTAATSPSDPAFSPGTVYGGVGEIEFMTLFGVKIGELVFCCYSNRRHDVSTTPEERKAKDKADLDFWKKQAQPVLVEISPACDVAQGTRRSAVLIAGVVLPVAAIQNAKVGEAFQALPACNLRWPTEKNPAQDSVLVFCCRYKATMPAATEPAYLKRWLRLRELPTASLRNWHSAHASRVGYVSVRD